MNANVRTGKRDEENEGIAGNKVLGAFDQDTLNDNSERLVSTADDHNLAIVNTLFSTSKNGISHTFNGRDSKRIDPILMRQRDRKLVRNVTVHPQPAFLPTSDHNVGFTYIKTPWTTPT